MISVTSQSPESGLIRELTFESNGSEADGDVIRKVDGRCSQRSVQMQMDVPSPPCHRQPTFTIGRAEKMLRHAYEGLEPSSTCKKSVSGK